MFNNHEYYVMFKMFIVQNLIRIACWKNNYTTTTCNTNGSYIYYPNEAYYEYDPDFMFLSPAHFPPRLTS